MPPNDIPDKYVHVDDGASSESRADHTVTTRILGKRPREGGEPNSDEDQEQNQGRASNKDQGALATTLEQRGSKGKERDLEQVHPKKKPKGADVSDEPSVSPSGGSVSRIFRNVYATRLFNMRSASSSSSSRSNILHDAQPTPKARQSVTFAPQVQIVSETGGRTGATQPLAPEASSLETGSETDNGTGSAVVSDALPFTTDTNPPADQDPLVTSQGGSSNIHNASCTFPDRAQSLQRLLSLTQGDSEVDGTDRTDTIGADNEMDTNPGSSGRTARTQPHRERTYQFIPASKDDLDTVNTQLGRIETQITNLRTVVESRHNSSRNETADDDSNDADTEETPPPRRLKRTGPIKHRSRRANRFNELIREHCRTLMKRIGDDAPFTGVILPHETLLVNFDPRRGPCCTTENFAIEILGTPKSAWNVSATKVFARDFVAHHPNSPYDTVKKAFSTHLRSLKRAYKQAGLDEAALKARQKEDRRKERKRSLYHRRLDIARAVSDLRFHVPMLARIGPDGMSSDETANENDVPQYRILGRNWRSLEITAWLRIFDAIYRHNRYGPAGTGSRGNNARMRFESMSMGHPQRAVRQLPRNAYRAEWYDGLDQYDREELDRCEDEVYAFTHVPSIQLAAQKPTGEPSHLRHYT